MKPRILVHLAVVIVIGLEKLHFSVAFEKTGEYEFPFKIPFHEAVGALHREFPMQVKYVKEIMHSIPVQREQTIPELAIANKNQEDLTQPEELKPQNDVTRSPFEEKDLLQQEIRSHFEVVKEAMGGEQEEAEKNLSLKKDSPLEYDENDEDSDSDGSEPDVETLDEDAEEDDEEEEEEEEEEEYEGEDTTEQETDNASEEEEDVDTFPYVLSLLIMGPGGHNLRHVKTGVITASPDGSVKKDDLLSLMTSLRNDEGNCIADSVNVKELVNVPHQIHISAPAVKFSSQIMDHKGTVYRQEGIRPFPFSMMGYIPNRQENGAQKQDGGTNTESLESSEEKVVTSAPKELERTRDTTNELLPTKPQYEKEAQFAKNWKPVDTRMYPKKYDASVDFNNKLRTKEFEFRMHEGSGDLQESDFGDEKEEEQVKKIVIIRPNPRVFQASFELDGVPKKDGLPIDAVDEMAAKENDNPMSSDKSQISFRHFWTPLRQILVTKIFGHPSLENDQS